jgi:hypothetical protein
MIYGKETSVWSDINVISVHSDQGLAVTSWNSYKRTGQVLVNECEWKEVDLDVDGDSLYDVIVSLPFTWCSLESACIVGKCTSYQQPTIPAISLDTIC